MDFEELEITSTSYDVSTVCLVELDASNAKLKFNRQALLDAINTAQNTSLAVISIAGPTGQNKTEIFAQLVHSLQGRESGSYSNGVSSTTVSKFSWPDNQSSPVKPGIWSTNRVFAVKNKGGQKIAILPLYVQSSQSFSWNPENNLENALLGLTSLVSSNTVFAVDKQLDEQCLTTIGNGLKYSVEKFFTKTKNPIRKPLQQATFLIQNWNFSSDYYYDWEGGQEFVVKDKLKEKPCHSVESWETRKLITGLFQNISGFLLPFSGKYDGMEQEQDSINPIYLERLNAFVSLLVDSTIQQQHLQTSGAKLVEVIHSYLQQAFDKPLNAMNIIRRFRIPVSPQPGIMDKFMADCLAVYIDTWNSGKRDKTFLNDISLRKNNDRSKNKAVSALEKIVFPEEDSDEADDEDDDDDQNSLTALLSKGKKQLTEDINKQQIQFRQQNALVKKEYLEGVIKELVKQYATSMKSAVARDDFSDASARRQSKHIISGKREDLLEKIGVEEGDLNEDDEGLLEKLKRLLREEEGRLLTANTTRSGLNQDAVAR